jgi:hypothetical protein
MLMSRWFRQVQFAICRMKSLPLDGVWIWQQRAVIGHQAMSGAIESKVAWKNARPS